MLDWRGNGLIGGRGGERGYLLFAVERGEYEIDELLVFLGEEAQLSLKVVFL